MNIQVFNDYINLFEDEVANSGFLRDLNDHIASISSNQNNIVTLRDIAAKTYSELERIYSSDMPEALSVLFAKKKPRPFTENAFNIRLKELIENKELPQDQFFSQLSQFLNELKVSVDSNVGEIQTIKNFISPYITENTKKLDDDNSAIISIVFKEMTTITSLREFSKSMSEWNKRLLIYHQLLTSTPPEDIKIIEIQNGTIDVVVNINFDVALNIADLFRIGFEMFGAYLAYKKLLKPITDSYFGNQQLIDLENQRDELMLQNIGQKISNKIDEQHKKAKENDAGIDNTSIPIKIQQVTDLVTSHIVKGNDLKLLAVPESKQENEVVKKITVGENSLKKKSLETRRELQFISSNTKHKLLEAYHAKQDEEGED